MLSKASEFGYKCTHYYAPQFERSLIWNDPEVAIEWPLLKDVPLQLSDKDAAGLPLSEAETYP